LREKLVDFFKRDTTLKVISVVAAIIIWFVVLSDDNPEVERTMAASYSFRQGQISVNSGDYVIKNIHEISGQITVRISGRSQIVNNTFENDLNVEFDFSGVNKAGTLDIPISITTNKVGLKVESYSPRSIKMIFEKIVDKSFNVQVEVDSSVIREGYEIYETRVTPESIPIESFESSVNRAATVKVHITLNDVNGEPIDRNKTVRKICRYYDKDGKELNEFEKNNVDVTLVVGKKVPLRYQVSGEPREGYYVSGSSINPTYVLVTGEPSALENLAVLNTDTVNISDAIGDVRRQVNINLPTGIVLLNPRLIPEVTVRIKPYANAAIDIKNTDISITGDNENLYSYTITGGPFKFTFTGKDEDIGKIKLSSLNPRVNVSGLGLGTHVLPIDITVPDNLQLTGSHSATVIITEKLSTHDPSDSPGPSSTPGNDNSE